MTCPSLRRSHSRGRPLGRSDTAPSRIVFGRSRAGRRRRRAPRHRRTSPLRLLRLRLPQPLLRFVRIRASGGRARAAPPVPRSAGQDVVVLFFFLWTAASVVGSARQDIVVLAVIVSGPVSVSVSVSVIVIVIVIVLVLVVFKDPLFFFLSVVLIFLLLRVVRSMPGHVDRVVFLVLGLGHLFLFFFFGMLRVSIAALVRDALAGAPDCPGRARCAR
mmetsp:Transcript_55221/g.165445  ORF Transcript_55221/g.165445 Transcript_55221/m.165445 type:complete len:217 (-) Transcript_55221:475-1125(-)